MRDGVIDGLRVDHIDGLLDPARVSRPLARRGSAPDVPIVVEKILALDETLPPRVAGAGHDGL